MRSEHNSRPTERISNQLPFTMLGIMGIVMLAFAVGSYFDEGRLVTRSAILALGSLGALGACLALRYNK
jgi:hypothetical protein